MPKRKSNKIIEQDNHYIIDGQQYDRVTRITGLIGYSEMKKLAETYGMGYVDNIMNRAAERGTTFHGYADMIAKKEISSAFLAGVGFSNPQLYKMTIDYQQWFKENIKEVIYSEKTMYSEKLKIAGRIDLYAICKDGTRALIDLKTSSKIMPSHLLQLAAYSCLLREDKNIPEKHKIIQVRPEGLTEIKIPNIKVDMGRIQFLNLLGTYRSLNMLMEGIKS